MQDAGAIPAHSTKPIYYGVEIGSTGTEQVSGELGAEATYETDGQSHPQERNKLVTANDNFADMKMAAQPLTEPGGAWQQNPPTNLGVYYVRSVNQKIRR